MTEVQRAKLNKDLEVGGHNCQLCAKRGKRRAADGIFGGFPKYSGTTIAKTKVKDLLYVCDSCGIELTNREAERRIEAKARLEAEVKQARSMRRAAASPAEPPKPSQTDEFMSRLDELTGVSTAA